MPVSELADRFARFEDHQFPGYPDAEVLQEAYDELVEKGGQLTACIQKLLTGGSASPDELPTFDIDVPPPGAEGIDPEQLQEFATYRAAVDQLVELTRSLLT